MIEAPHYSAAGASKKAVALTEALFDGTVNEDVLHRAVITYLSNQRQGTSNTLTRSEVSAGALLPPRLLVAARALAAGQRVARALALIRQVRDPRAVQPVFIHRALEQRCWQ